MSRDDNSVAGERTDTPAQEPGEQAHTPRPGVRIYDRPAQMHRTPAILARLLIPALVGLGILAYLLYRVAAHR